MKLKSGTYITWSIVILCVLAIVGAAVFFVLRTKANRSENDVDSETPDGSLEDEPLSFGSRGSDVVTLQRFLNQKLCFYSHERNGRPIYKGEELASLVCDGIFGAKTQCATKWWFGKDSVKPSEIK